MIRHILPSGIEVAHPECALLTGEGDICTCIRHYKGATNLARAIEVADRLDNRRQPVAAMGAGPDADETDRPGGVSKVFGDTQPDYGNGNVNEGGFWREGEDLRCKAGQNFKAGDLDYSRFRGPTWQRAKRCAA